MFKEKIDELKRMREEIQESAKEKYLQIQRLDNELVNYSILLEKLREATEDFDYEETEVYNGEDWEDYIGSKRF